jgi:Zn-dependent protease with chaperone function
LHAAEAMSESGFSKCSCQHCGQRLEFPSDAVGAIVSCPGCSQQTTLSTVGGVSGHFAGVLDPPQIPADDLVAALRISLPKARTSIVYQLGMIIVALAMIALPVIYLAMITAAGYGVYFWASHFSYLLNSGVGGGRVWLLKACLYFTPLFTGVVLVLFMIKPLFAPRPARAQPLALVPEMQPMLFTFVRALCQAVGAPFPKRIDVNCELNASASFRRGVFSFIGNDLVLTIGLPLVAGLTLRQFAGVLAHEFGHFTQGFAMRLTYVIRSINGWFARVVYERDAWDVWLDESAEDLDQDWRLMIIINVVRLAVGFSRFLLKLLMYIGHGVGCFMLRQMEYDADQYEINLAGSEAFESTMRRFHVLGKLTEQSYKKMRAGWNLDQQLPDDFPAYLIQRDKELPHEQRTKYEDAMGLQPSGIFETHPSNGDRIRRARQAGAEGLFLMDGPALVLLPNSGILARQVTHLHYAEDLGLPMEMAKLKPVESFAGTMARS